MPGSLLRLRPRSIFVYESLSHAQFIALVAAMHHSLTALDIPYISPEIIASLTSLTRLVSLNVRSNLQVTTPLTSLTSLRTLSAWNLPLSVLPLLPRSLTHLGDMSYASKGSEAAWEALLSMPLTALRVSSTLSTAEITRLSALSQLRSLQCSLERDVVLPPFPHLTCLRCYGGCVAPPAPLPAGLRELLRLNHDYSAVTPTQLNAAFAHCTALTQLGLNHCRLTTGGLSALCSALPAPAALLSLSLGWSDCIVSVKAVSVCVSLTTLNLVGCSGLGGRNARDVLPRLPALTTLTLDGINPPVRGLDAAQSELFPLVSTVFLAER